MIKHAAAKSVKCGSVAVRTLGLALKLACRLCQLAVASNQSMNTATATIPNGRPHLALGEMFSFAYETFCSNKAGSR